MSTLVSLYRDINLLLDMAEARIKQMKALYLKKCRKSEHYDTTEPEEIVRSEKKPTAPRKERRTLQLIELPSGNCLSFD